MTTDAARSRARTDVRRAIAELARSDNGIPGALAQIRAATVIRDMATRVAHDHVRAAREGGHDWTRIGQALGFGDAAPGGVEAEPYAVAVAAYEATTGTADVWHRTSFAWRCRTCGTLINDHGPYDGDPREREEGHTPACERINAEVAAWDALWTDE